MPKKKSTWVSRLKKDVKTLLSGPGHSPAGKKYAQKAKKKKKEIQTTHLSRQAKKQLQGLSGGDYAEVMKILRKR